MAPDPANAGSGVSMGIVPVEVEEKRIISCARIERVWKSSDFPDIVRSGTNTRVRTRDFPQGPLFQFRVLCV